LILKHHHYDFLSLESSLLSCLRFFFFLILRGILILIMYSFLSDFAIGIGGIDSGGSIQQLLMDWEVISIGGSSSEDTRCGASDNESSSSERLRASRRTSGGTSCLYGRA